MDVGMTPKQQLLEDRLGMALGKYLRQCRREGLSYRTISAVIEERTGIYVSKSSLASWQG